VSSAADTTPARPARRRRVSPIVITIIVVVGLIVAFLALTGLFADILWYSQLGYLEVLTTQWVAAISMFAVAFVCMSVPVYICIELAYRKRPIYAKLNDQLDHYQQVIEPLRRVAFFAVPALIGLFGGLAAASRWSIVLMWLNRTAAGTTDPQFGLDVSFYLFELPFYRGLVAFASAAVLIAGIASIVTAYFYGGITFAGRSLRVSKSARIQITVLAAVYLALQGVSFWLDQYTTVTSYNGLFTGAGYSDVNATIPVRAILSGVAMVVAVLFIITAWTGRWRLPLIGTALLIVLAIIAGSLYPWIVQRFQVLPSQKTLESSYIQRNIDGTRQAYGVDGVQVVPYAATTDATPGALRNDAVTTANIRIMDPEVIAPTVTQLQRIRQYYSFPSSLDVDRYTIDGQTQDAVVGVRDLNGSSLTDNSWYNRTLVYTHGYGLVAAFGNERSADGLPVFMEQGIPSSGQLGTFQPRVYFGENSPEYSIVGGTGDKNIELDYPAGDAGDTYTTFSGDGGPKLDNFFTRLIYALKFQSEQIVLSDAVTDQSQILYDRDPALRVQKVAPYLTLDSDPYPSVVDGRIVWIIDGYTTSANYPYSQQNSLSGMLQDANTTQRPATNDGINYIRNSVKATVDAYDGHVTLYAWDPSDPILQTWEKIFPNTIRPVSEMSGQLLSHVRYPEDLFKVQRFILGTYHVTDADTFYSGTDAWVTPTDPTLSSNAQQLAQPPYYLTLSAGQDVPPAFSLYSTYIPAAGGDTSRSNVLTGYLAVDSDAGSTAGQIGAQYGTLRLLTLPKGDTIPAPGQVQNSFNTNPSVSGLLNILRQGGTQVISGNLLTLPVGGGLLYVQPVYVQSNSDNAYPILQKVLVAFGDNIAFEDTLDAALDKLFGGNSGARAGDNQVQPDSPGTTPSPTPTPAPTPSPSTTPSPSPAPSPSSGGESPELRQALLDMQAAIAARDAAMKAGDWAAYGVADQQLRDALARALAAQG